MKKKLKNTKPINLGKAKLLHHIFFLIQEMWLMFNVLIIQHPEELALSNEGVMNQSEISTRLGLSGIPNQAESIIINRDLQLLELTGGRYHVSHISTSQSVREIRQAKKNGLNVTCDTAPQYFSLNDLAIEEYRTFARLSPPLRS